MRIRAGRLRHRLTLQRKTETRTSTGDVTIAWVTDSTVWGAIEPLSGKEYIAASQTQNEAEVKILIRYHATIADTWRVVNDGKAYSIHAILNADERNNAMTLMCSQGVAEQNSLP
jgi:SPP1 family predicted phage head-tail adaptor